MGVERATTASAVSSGLVMIRATMNFAIPPVWSADPLASVLEQLDTLVMRYIPQLEGVLLTHQGARFLQPLGYVDGDSAFVQAPASFRSLVWRPQVGMMLEGTMTLSSPSHVSLLLYDTFNAAISAPHLPSDAWDFVYFTDEDERDASDRSVGYWRHKETGNRLGGATRKLRFTVISMTVANHMLSLHGSLLDEPFSVPPPRPGSLSFDQAFGATELMDEEAAAPEAPTKPRRVRWEDDSDDGVVEVADEGEEEPTNVHEAADSDRDDEDEDNEETAAAEDAKHLDAQVEQVGTKKEKKKEKKDKTDKKDKKDKSAKVGIKNGDAHENAASAGDGAAKRARVEDEGSHKRIK